MQEDWKDVAGFEGVYQVSNLGRIKTLEKRIRTWNGHRTQKETCIKPIVQRSGYVHVGLWRNQVCKQVRLHRLVAQAFCVNDDPENKTQVNHINEDKLDNRACNLEWVTPKQNTNHGTCILRRGRKGSSRQVVQLDKTSGEVLGVFPNERQASLACGRLPHGEIRKVCIGEQLTAYGYRWAYA